MVDMPVTLTSVLAMRLARMATKQRTKSTSNGSRVAIAFNVIVRVMLHLAGFSLLTLAGFQFNIIAGLIVAALSCFVMSRLMAQDPAVSETEVRRAPDLRTGR